MKQRISFSNIIGVLLLLTAIHAATARTGFAQQIEVQLATEQSPHYVGVPAVVQLTAKGLQARPEPECRVQVDSPAIRASVSGISPRIVQRMYQSGGKVRRIEEVTYTIQIRVLAKQPGTFEVGPFLISQNGNQQEVEPIELSFQEVPETDAMRIKLDMPTYAYPDQRVSVKIEWWFAGDTENVSELNIDATALDEFQFTSDPAARRGDSRLPIQTAEGTVPLRAEARTETEDDKQYTVVTAERTLIPTRTGRFEIEPISATIELVTEWQQRRRSMFGDPFGGSLFDQAFGGGRRPAKVELFRAVGEPSTFEVKPFPKNGQPESFAGAVGKGFSLDVSADRTVVRVGDPIRLTLNLRGDGNIEGATLPDLAADGGLDPNRFRLPEGDSAGVLEKDQNAKRFAVSVRVLDESIDEIPAIAFSWFDAETENYRTTRSKPIALRVMPANMVGADAVVSNQPSERPPKENESPIDGAMQGDRKSSAGNSFSGANLAIETDPSRLLRGSEPLLGHRAVQLGGYVLGSLCVLVALVDRRRRQVDPNVRRVASVLKQQRLRVAAAAQLPEKAAAKEIADALGTAAALFPGRGCESIRKMISECEIVAYRPGDDGETLDRKRIDRALAAIDELWRDELGAS